MSTTISLTGLEGLDPEAREHWRSRAQAETTGLCLTLIADGRYPGVVGKTTPAAALAVQEELRGGSGAARPPRWTASRIRRWQDRSIAGIRASLLGAERSFTPDHAATVALGLCDLAVRDVALVDLAHGGEALRTQADRRLWPIAETAPDYLRAPAGTVLALLEWSAGRRVDELLDWATEATPDYTMAGLVRQMAASGMDPSTWIRMVSTIDEAQCLNRTAPPSAAAEPDPLTQANRSDPALSVDGVVR